ncbi:MAG TPA: hypothetical protein VGD87_12645, partial [Archangium sp.]
AICLLSSFRWVDGASNSLRFDPLIAGPEECFGTSEQKIKTRRVLARRAGVKPPRQVGRGLRGEQL